jgi:tRNA 2-selenouridine synthase
VSAYEDVLADAERLKDRLSPLRFHRGHDVVDGWIKLIEAGDKRALTSALMQQHYDPAYTKSSRARVSNVIASIDAASLDAVGLSNAADQIKAVLDQL